ARLEAQGCDAQTVWTTLEQFNLGRLRVAAKGVRREGARLVAVGDGEQRREGMFMIGQVAALRGERCTVAELHREVSEGSRLEAPEPVAARARAASDVAIVG